ncbi:MAG: VOC family protein [Thermoleophilia bacterium]
MSTITPFLLVDEPVEDVAAFYAAVFPGSPPARIAHLGEGPGGPVVTATFELCGQRFTALNGGPTRPFTEAISFLVECEDQPEVDRLWAALGDGGNESVCGWLQDRYGLWWQIVPAEVLDLIAGPDPAAAERARQAVWGMRKLDLAEVRRAHAG